MTTMHSCLILGKKKKDLNTDLALSAPSRQEARSTTTAEHPHPPHSDTPHHAEGLNFACLISLSASAGIRLVISEFLHIPFSVDQHPDGKTLLLAERDGEPLGI